MEWLDYIKNISLIIASWAAIYGITSWRREFVGRRRIELAEEVLVSFYEARDVIRIIRNPFGFGGEGSSREPGENESPEEKKIYDKAYVVIERYKKHQELFNKIRSMRYRFVAQFGMDSSSPFDSLNKVVNDIFLASEILSEYWNQQGRERKSESQRQEYVRTLREFKGIFWENFIKPDPISPRVDALIQEIEEKCQSIINPQSKNINIPNWLNDPFKINV